MGTLAMFPLGSVLFPRAIMPLRVFEPRYLTMIAECRAGSGELGVVLIERGSEVGGGDIRFDVGTRARIGQVAELGGGQLAVVLLGLERFEVTEWEDDDPYPRAQVASRPEPRASAALADAVEAAQKSLERVLALASELGSDVGPGIIELPADPVAAAWSLCASAPISSLDAYRLLLVDDPAERMAFLTTELDELADTLTAQLAGD